MNDVTGMPSEKISSKVQHPNSSAKLLTAVNSVCHCQTQAVQHYSLSSKTQNASQVNIYHLFKEMHKMGTQRQSQQYSPPTACKQNQKHTPQRS